MDCKRIKAAAVKLAHQAGRLQMKKLGKVLDIRWKGLTDPVTEVDKASEEAIIRGIRRNFPGHSILAEESGSHGLPDAEFLWIIDPLDGTVNYSHGIPQFCVSIGVYERGKPLIGVVHAPALGETFVAEKGKGAFLNGRRIRVSRHGVPHQALLSSGFAYGARVSGENVREWSECLVRFQAIRRMGAAALDLCWVAAGRFDAFWEYGLKPWDVAAAGLMVSEAGGRVSNLAGRPYDMFKPGIVASNKKLHKPLVSAIQRALKRRLQWPPK
jgi:myo-inositol-1(or 4)-monophosphatase